MVGAVFVWAPPEADPDIGRESSSFGVHPGRHQWEWGLRRGKEDTGERPLLWAPGLNSTGDPRGVPEDEGAGS